MRLTTWWPVGMAMTLLLAVGSARPASAQDWRRRHTPEQLLAIATDAYQKLPAVPSPADASVFLRAFANLHAYAQVSPRVRNNRAHANEVNGALAWLSSNLGNVRPAGTDGKADDPSSGMPLIEKRGLAAYDSVRNRRPRLASPFRSYVAAVTNLYVVRQATANPSRESLDALSWLGDNPIGVAAGVSGKADAPGSIDLPTRRKPSVLGRAPGRPAAVRAPVRAPGAVVRDHRVPPPAPKP
jgi:hypothetical protein